MQGTHEVLQNIKDKYADQPIKNCATPYHMLPLFEITDSQKRMYIRMQDVLCNVREYIMQLNS